MSLQLVIIGALVMATTTTTMAQRSSFAGSRGSGYKDGLIQQQPQPSSSNNNNDFIGNRNLDSGIAATTTRIPSINSISPNDRLPIDALGDAYLVNHYNR